MDTKQRATRSEVKPDETDTVTGSAVTTIGRSARRSEPTGGGRIVAGMRRKGRSRSVTNIVEQITIERCTFYYEPP